MGRIFGDFDDIAFSNVIVFVMNMILLALDDDLSDRVFNLTFDKNRNSLVHLGAE